MFFPEWMVRSARISNGGTGKSRTGSCFAATVRVVQMPLSRNNQVVKSSELQKGTRPTFD